MFATPLISEKRYARALVNGMRCSLVTKRSRKHVVIRSANSLLVIKTVYRYILEVSQLNTEHLRQSPAASGPQGIHRQCPLC